MEVGFGSSSGLSFAVVGCSWELVVAAGAVPSNEFSERAGVGSDGRRFDEADGTIGVGVLRLGAGMGIGTAVAVDCSVSLSGVSIDGSFAMGSFCAVDFFGAVRWVSVWAGVETAASGPSEIEGTAEGAFEVDG